MLALSELYLVPALLYWVAAAHSASGWLVHLSLGLVFGLPPCVQIKSTVHRWDPSALQKCYQLAAQKLDQSSFLPQPAHFAMSL